MKNISYKSNFTLPPENFERVKAAAAGTQAKYDITNRSATNDDFKRICEGEDIRVYRCALILDGYALNLRKISGVNGGKLICFSKNKHISLRSKFFFIGAFIIPSMYDLKRFFTDEDMREEIEIKHTECELFASILLKREVSR